ncbi:MULTISPECIES: DUF7678 domain-containing protein [Bacillus amyloliquefaciens group]|uniref:DUF7678 domain-containing protein n=1 Tax=Bacillus amyloliquefaciens group TaxID=1938374 RepID=UPI00073C2832|nr:MULTISPECIES: hypothetical protein [Bacillus amyloliquefaciens group]KTF59738.1 hypothetical protein AR691_13475 [Bacillus amyloliquefaciens]
MGIQFTKFKKGELWVEGVVDNGKYSFMAKLFDDKNDDLGIQGGRVSKLTISIGEKWTGMDNCLVNYDRGWDIRPSKEYEDLFKAVLSFLEGAPKTRF